MVYTRPIILHNLSDMGEVMKRYHFLHPELLKETFEKVRETLPDSLRSPGAFASVCATSTLFEVGDFEGVFWLSDLAIGWKATAHIVLWGEEVKKKYTRAREIVRDLFDLYKLRRMQAFIPVQFTWACEYAEKLGFTLEGILRKFDYYGGEPKDVAVYALLKEDLQWDQATKP